MLKTSSNTKLDNGLLDCVKEGKFDKVKKALKEGANPNCKDEFGWTPLHRACNKGYGEVAKLLIEEGAIVDTMSNAGSTPLHWACNDGDTQIASLLLEKGANVDAMSESGLMPLHCACRNDHIEIVRLLLEKGVSVDTLSKVGSTPLHEASYYGNADIVKLLIEKGAALEVVSKRGCTALSLAQQNHKTEVVGVLSEKILVVVQENVLKLTQQNDNLLRRVSLLTTQLEEITAAKWIDETEAQVCCDKGGQHFRAQQYLQAVVAFQKALVLRPEFSKAQQGFDETLAALQHERQRLHDECDELTVISRRLQQEQARLEAEKVNWQATLTHTQHELDERGNLQAERQDHTIKEQKHLENLAQLIRKNLISLEEKEKDLQKKHEELNNDQQNHANWQHKAEELSAQLRQLESDKALLTQERETLKEQQQGLMLRIKALEEDQRVFQQDIKGLDQIKTSLQDAQQELVNREKEWKDKQDRAEKAEREFRQAKRIASERAELLEVQLRIFKQHGVPPEEKAFRTFLSEVKQLRKIKETPSPSCFISYAWEDTHTTQGETANKDMQQWLTRLEGDLRKLDVTVFLDIKMMHGHMREAMVQNIAKSDFFFVIGTPRLKQRIEDGLPKSLQECITHGHITKLKEYLEELKGGPQGNPDYDTFNPTTNVAFEFVHIWAKVCENPSTLIPLLLCGDHATAFPAGIHNFLIYDARGSYHRLLTASANPVGLIPLIFQVHSEQGAWGENYQASLENFELKIKEIAMELKLAQMESQLKQQI